MAFDWRASRPFNPVWKTREDLHRILARYRVWYEQGRSDVEISALIRQQITIPFNPQSAFPRKGKR
jgi:hypothetical protein